MINSDIKAVKVLVVGNGKSREMLKEEALQLAEENGLDLIEVGNIGSDCPTCKIADYNKMLYEQEKARKENKKKQPKNELKEVRFSTDIAPHDVLVKVNMISKMLKHGDRVKLTMIFRGRQMRFIQDAGARLMQIREMVGEPNTIETPLKVAGNRASLVIKPAKK